MTTTYIIVEGDELRLYLPICFTSMADAESWCAAHGLRVLGNGDEWVHGGVYVVELSPR